MTREIVEWCERCSVDGYRVPRRVRGEIRTSVWMCGCAVEPCSVTPPPASDLRCVVCTAQASGLAIVARHGGLTSYAPSCGDCIATCAQRDGYERLLDESFEWSAKSSLLLIEGRGRTREHAIARWRERLGAYQREVDTWRVVALPPNYLLDKLFDRLRLEVYAVSGAYK